MKNLRIVFLYFMLSLAVCFISKATCFSNSERGQKSAGVLCSARNRFVESEMAKSGTEILNSKAVTSIKKPTLFGDGINDDTKAIQFLLDEAKPMVYLPVPQKHYLISKPLKIHSNQSLVLDRFTVIRLVPKSDCLMVTNDDHENGNENIAVIGGIWDMNNVSQSPNPILGVLRDPDAEAYHPDRYLGICMRFVNVHHFTLRSVIFRDPVTFCTQFARMRNFTIEDITFDYRNWNPVPQNMDGIHLDGGCQFGRIANLKGATNDDLVALNADDSRMDSPFQGPIEDITIDGIYARDCHSAVRILSSGSPVQRITIRNIYGTYYVYAIGFTKFFHNRKNDSGYFDSIVLENLHIGKADPKPHNKRLLPLVWFERGTFSGRITIRDFHRLEKEIDIASVLVDRDAEVESLLLDNCSVVNQTERKINFLENHGNINSLNILNFYGRSPGGGSVIANEGILKKVKVENSDISGMELGINKDE